MRRFKNVKIAALILVGLFALNSAVLYALFDINIFKPEKPSNAEDTAGEGYNSGIYPGYNPQWNAERRGDPGLSDSDELERESENDAGAEDGQNTGISPTPFEEDKMDAKHASEECFLTEEQVTDLEKLDLRDKLSAVAMIAKLGGEDTDAIYEMAQDGVTYGELDEIEAILGKYLQPDEIERLRAILEKSINGNE